MSDPSVQSPGIPQPLAEPCLSDGLYLRVRDLPGAADSSAKSSLFLNPQGPAKWQTAWRASAEPTRSRDALWAVFPAPLSCDRPWAASWLLLLAWWGGGFIPKRAEPLDQEGWLSCGCDAFQRCACRGDSAVTAQLPDPCTCTINSVSVQTQPVDYRCKCCRSLSVITRSALILVEEPPERRCEQPPSQGSFGGRLHL